MPAARKPTVNPSALVREAWQRVTAPPPFRRLRRRPECLFCLTSLAGDGGPAPSSAAPAKRSCRALRRMPSGWMVDALVEAVRARGDIGVDWILRLPSNREQLAERGFNQAALVAAGVARELALPLHRDELLRVRHTAPQASPDHDERWLNVRGAFDVAAPPEIAGQRIALIDEVMTTGAALDAAAKALKKAGAARVEAWVIARTDRGREVATQREAPQDV